MTVRDALLLSNIAFLALVALAFVASVVVFVLNRASEKAKDRELAAYQTAAEMRIHSAQADAAAALERAVAGASENLRTKERTAMLVREAVALHAQTLAARTPAALEAPSASEPIGAAPIDAKVADRTLSTDQRGKMLAILIRRPGEVTVMSGVGAEAERYATEIRAIFSAAGWTVESGVVVEPKMPLAPLSLVLGTSGQDLAVRKAFQAAGVAAANRPRSPMDRPSTIYVGS
jgi:hypothetical protein